MYNKLTLEALSEKIKDVQYVLIKDREIEDGAKTIAHVELKNGFVFNESVCASMTNFRWELEEKRALEKVMSTLRYLEAYHLHEEIYQKELNPTTPVKY